MRSTLKRAHSHSRASQSTGVAAAPGSTADGAFLDESPFPALVRPTHDEAHEVYALLCTLHGGTPPQPSLSVSSLTENAPNILDGLISTILSQSTSGTNSLKAKLGLDTAFGRSNFAAIVAAPRERVIEAIRCGGLAKKKAATIQHLLIAVCERHESYSLQFLATSVEGERKTDAEVTEELLSYDGVGPKTASCVLSLCLERNSFPVDTHVWRLSKALDWVPASADRILTQAHLEQRLPANLKLPLHDLMMRHGRICNGCKNNGSGACPLKGYARGRG
ncbi:DNA glycosylase [Mycena rebaudengoi]|nr:DNA glycosylase [Mycena rebaudengoi]